MALNTGKLLSTPFGEVYYSFTDNQQRRTLILMHGNSSSGSFWKPLMASQLSEAFNFLTIDLPGHGQSPYPQNPEEIYSFTSYASLLVAVIKNLKPENYYLIGHSLGGHIILESLDRLNSCKGAMIMGTPPLGIPPQLEKAFIMSPQFLSFIQAGSDRAVMESTFRSMVPEGQAANAELLLEDYFKTDPQARVCLNQNVVQGKFIDEQKALRLTNIPVHIIIAENDQMVNPAYFGEFLPEQEVLSIPAAGHYAPLEKPEDFVKLILDKFVA